MQDTLNYSHIRKTFYLSPALLLCLLWVGFGLPVAVAQRTYEGGDSPDTPLYSQYADTVSDVLQDGYDTEELQPLLVSVRSFDSVRLSEYREKKGFEYMKTPKATAPNALQLLLLRIANWLDRQFRIDPEVKQKIGNKAFDFLVYGIATFAVIMMIWGLFNTKIRTIFLKEASPLAVDFKEAETNITETDFDTLIQKALTQADYRGATRLLYLEALKTLAQNNWINWKANKTNHEYLMELYQSPFRKSFTDLTYIFEYIFYGDFPVNQQIYEETAGVFKEFRTKVSKKIS